MGAKGGGSERDERGNGGGREEPRADDEANLALLGILVRVALAMQVAVEHGPRQLAGVALHLEVLGRLLGDEQEVLKTRRGNEADKNYGGAARENGLPCCQHARSAGRGLAKFSNH